MRNIVACTIFFSALIFSGKLNAQTISVVHEEHTPSEIIALEDSAWSVSDGLIYEGLDNGVYWFKIVLQPSLEDHYLTIPESHITRAELFSQDLSPIRPVSHRFITFKLNKNRKSQTLYLRVNCLLEARIPIEIQTSEQFQTQSQSSYLAIGLYIGIVLSVLVFNLFSFLSFNDRTYLHYIFMVTPVQNVLKWD